MISNLSHSLAAFWRQHPALLYGLGIFTGLFLALKGTFSLYCLFLLFWSPFLLVFIFPRERLGLRLGVTSLLMILSFILVRALYLFPHPSEEGVQGTAHFDISSLSLKKTPFGNLWIYRGALESFIPENSPTQTSIAIRIPCTIQLGEDKHRERPRANCSYRIQAKLKEISPGYYVLTEASKSPWYPLKGTWSLAEKRFQIKNWLKQFLKAAIIGEENSHFLAGIATGEFDDRVMQSQFARFGLQHIMAISGFHFSIIAAILSFLFQACLPKKFSSLVMISFLTLYFIFLGSNASIIRSWIAILIALFGHLVGKESAALNSLGLALIVIFLMDPLLCLSIGFTLSFLSTAAILFFFSGCDQLLQKLWLKRPLSHLIQMDHMNQHAFVLLNFFRQGIALTFAVHLVALPMMLFYFHQFPWMGLVYNLFFPFMVSVSMLLLIFGLFAGLLFSPLADFIHMINSYYTHFMLNFTSNMPLSLNFIWYVEGLSSTVIALYLIGLFWAAILLSIYSKEQQYIDI